MNCSEIGISIRTSNYYAIGRAMTLARGLLFLLRVDYTHLWFDSNDRGHVIVPMRRNG